MKPRQGSLRPAHIYMDFPSVRPTQKPHDGGNSGWRCDSDAREPGDLAILLNEIRSQVKGWYQRTITMTGVELHVWLMWYKDRIRQRPFMVAAWQVAIFWERSHRPLDLKLLEMGVESRTSTGKSQGIHVNTHHPGFPTDMQAQFTALMTVAKGIHHGETVFWESLTLRGNINIGFAFRDYRRARLVLLGTSTGAEVPISRIFALVLLVLTGLAQGETVW